MSQHLPGEGEYVFIGQRIDERGLKIAETISTFEPMRTGIEITKKKNKKNKKEVKGTDTKTCWWRVPWGVVGGAGCTCHHAVPYLVFFE